MHHKYCAPTVTSGNLFFCRFLIAVAAFEVEFVAYFWRGFFGYVFVSLSCFSFISNFLVIAFIWLIYGVKYFFCLLTIFSVSGYLRFWWTLTGVCIVETSAGVSLDQKSGKFRTKIPSWKGCISSSSLSSRSSWNGIFRISLQHCLIERKNFLFKPEKITFFFWFDVEVDGAGEILLLFCERS